MDGGVSFELMRERESERKRERKRKRKGKGQEREGETYVFGESLLHEGVDDLDSGEGGE